MATQPMFKHHFTLKHTSQRHKMLQVTQHKCSKSQSAKYNRRGAHGCISAFTAFRCVRDLLSYLKWVLDVQRQLHVVRVVALQRAGGRDDAVMVNVSLWFVATPNQTTATTTTTTTTTIALVKI